MSAARGAVSAAERERCRRLKQHEVVTTFFEEDIYMPFGHSVTTSTSNHDPGDEEWSNIGDSTLCRLIGSCVNREVQNEAATRFADCYIDRLLRLIERNFAVKYRRGLEAEDVAQSVMKSMLIRMRDGKLTPGAGKEIWRLLCTVALNKIRNRIRDARALKNDVGREICRVDDSGLAFEDARASDAIEFKELLEALERDLGPEASSVLMMRLEGFSMQEIAKKLDISTRSVSRHMKYRIRPAVLAHLPEELWMPILKPQDR